ncbi:TonB-dependent receptor [Schleiferiaceae bacterium]|nr:TonB-dependent receptor [Schleiferiaceae bacterium]
MNKFKTAAIYISLMVFSFSVYAAGEVEYVWLTVRNAMSGEPIEGVSITVDQAYIGETGPLGRILIPEGMPGQLIALYHTSYAAGYYSRKELQERDYEVFLRESVLNIQEVVIRANRMEQQYQKTAQEVRSIDAKQLDQQFQATTADALAIDPNVFIQKSQAGGGSPMIRGMSTSRVLVMVDGIRMNNAIFRSGNVHNVISVDGESVSNMEISLGPGSVLHGSDALGGVMHINTYDAHFGDSTEILQSLVFTLSNQNAQLSRRPNFRINYGGLNWAGMTSLTYTQYHDIRMGQRILSWTPASHLSNTQLNYLPTTIGSIDTVRTPEDDRVQYNTSYEKRNITQKFKVRIAERTTFKSGLHVSLTGDVNRYDRFTEMMNGRPKYAQWNYGPQAWIMSYLSIENRDKTAISDWMKFTLSGQYFEESRKTRKFKAPVGRVQREQVYINQINFDASKKISNKSTVLYGAEFIGNNLTSTAHHYHYMNTDSTWNAQSRYANGSHWISGSIFAHYDTDFSKHIAFSAGSRINGISMYTPISFRGFNEDARLKFLAPSAEMGITYHKPSFKYFLNLSSGFRAPNIDDASKVFDSQPGAVIVPNSNLREERLYSAELGAKQKLGKSWVVDASFYYSFLDNALERAPYTFMGSDSINFDGELSQVLAVQNLDYAWIWGYQFGVRTDISENLNWMIHWAHPFGKDSQGYTLRHVSPFNATSNFSFHKNKWRSNLILRYNGAIDAEDIPFSERSKTHMYALNDNGEVYTPAWYTINLHASYVFNKNILVRGGIDNIMDVQYRGYASGIVAPGRSLFISLRGSI